MPPRAIYELTVDSWASRERIIVRSSAQTIIGFFSLPFIRSGGDNTWGYVLNAIKELVDISGGQGWRLVNEHGELLEDDLAPWEGECWLRAPGGAMSESSPPFSQGPEYFRRGQAPNPEGSFSTRSDSKRSSVNQSRFRTGVIARDGTCLVTDVDYDNCTACHIVPYSRLDVYENILGIQNEVPIFYASCGLLLRDDLHHAFDRLECSFYLKRSLLLVFAVSRDTDRIPACLDGIIASA
ncbi:hypothetical protein BCR39DRAFT_52162 [Naematelia encephala]|uniref:HNH nuclease domain-containing protein n=1 Tax=Naematelia encephala TaxID=71784 RepID=A0A1Y2AGQ5_9TREE|nr:hypothetical protein BCR39DRAFT_52162 [Naematelia encephala]